MCVTRMEKRLDFIANGISDFGHFLLGLALQLVHLAFGLHFVITGDRSAGLLYTAFDFVNRSIGFLVLWGFIRFGVPEFGIRTSVSTATPACPPVRWMPFSPTTSFPRNGHTTRNGTTTSPASGAISDITSPRKKTLSRIPNSGTPNRINPRNPRRTS